MLTALRSWQAVLVLLLIFLCACAAGNQGPQRAAADLHVRLLDGSLHSASGLPYFQEMQQKPGAIELRIFSKPGAKLRGAYLEIGYDPSLWQPAAADLLQQGPDGRPWLGLMHDNGKGELQAGIVASELESYPGLDSSEELLSISFTRIDGSSKPVGSAERYASAAPVNPQSQCTLSLDQANSRLNWEYRCTGDYDQNGLVSISDLTPLGIHFGKSGPFTESSIESVVDGDGNGEINLGDITSIGQNFGRGVESYNIYQDPDGDKAPESPSAPSQIAAAGSFAFSSASGSAAAQRLQFSRSSVITGNNYYWVRPVHQGVEGIASNTVFAIELAPQAPVAAIMANPSTGIAPLLVTLDASGSTDANGDIDHYDWDFENNGSYDATTSIPQISRSYGGGPWTARVRVVDSGGLSDTATVNMNFVQPEWNISVVDSYAPVYNYPVMVHTGSRPVIVYDQYNFDPIHDRLFVVRGSDTQGSSWSSPTRLDLSMELVGDFDLDLVDGRAAVCYYDTGNQRFRYMRSTADDTSSWGNPITLETDDNSLETYGKDCSLEVIDGLPHVAFRGDSQLHIYIKAATDATGTAWGSRALVAPDLIKVGGITLLDAGGRPGILWSSIIEARVGYVHENKVSGQFFNTDLYTGIPQLANDAVYHQGKPLALYLTGNPTFDARVAVAADADGTSWESANILESSSQNGCSMAIVNGIPMLVYCSLSSNQLLFHRALDPAGSSWSAAEVIDDGGGGVVSQPSLIEVSGAPAVAYAWGDDPEYELRYAIYF